MLIADFVKKNVDCYLKKNKDKYNYLFLCRPHKLRHECEDDRKDIVERQLNSILREKFGTEVPDGYELPTL